MTIMAVCIIISLTACSNEMIKSLDNDVQQVFKDIDGKLMSEYILEYQYDEKSAKYIKNNNQTIDNLKEALAVQKDIFTYEDEFGGSPYIVIESIELIGEQWIYCISEDGRSSADMLIKFIIEDDKFNFKVCAVDYNNQGTKVLLDADLPDE